VRRIPGRYPIALYHFAVPYRRVKPIEIECYWCGKPFLGDSRRRYCGAVCRHRAQREQARVRMQRYYRRKHEFWDSD
jgi:hypothetical protein